MEKIIKKALIEFDKKFNHDEPNGRALVLFSSNSDGQIPASLQVKEFMLKIFVEILEESIKQNKKFKKQLEKLDK